MKYYSGTLHHYISSHHLKALYAVLHLALVQLVDDVRLRRVLPRQFQSVKHRTAQLLYVMLLPRCCTHTDASTTVHTLPSLF